MGTRPRARKRFGQHFLERPWIDKLLREVNPKPADVFLEIGPGPGGLTRPLAVAARRVVGVEIDRDLAAELQTSAPSNLTIIEGDFLEMTPGALAERLFPDDSHRAPVRVVGNLPYNAASPILFRLLEIHDEGLLPLVDATIMLQREVADRLLAPAGSKDYGVLTILVGRLARVERLLDLPPGAFRPPPKVRSTVVRLTFHASDPFVRNATTFTALVRAVFTRRRKTIANALLAYPDSEPMGIAGALERAAIDPRSRPEALSGADFARLADAISSSGLQASGSRDPRS
jgi:16S rRNA (adenine1518-N6/adenine1519-N6)-dimethyltransferase